MNHQRFAFIIRIWHEEQEDSPQIRGSIQLVSSTEKSYFSSLEEVPNLLRAMSHVDHEQKQNGK